MLIIMVHQNNANMLLIMVHQHNAPPYHNGLSS